LSIKNVGKSPEILNCPVSDRNSARRVYRQSSSASRFTAGAFGFLTFTQCTELQNTNVRFGSKADIGLPPVDVRFTAKSGHKIWPCASTSVPCAITGHGSLPRHHIAAQILELS
jgi:hypothetical protein